MTLPSVSLADAGLPASAPAFAGLPATGAAEFSQWMSGLAPAAAARTAPSMVASVVRLSAAAGNQALARIGAAAPPGASLPEQIAFHAQKEVDVNNMKTLSNLAIAAARITRKTVDTVLNSK
ncbi:hypothetical protein GT347_19685 [Xylophilus rhododendri]|uniref:Uncharacterized protein n=1 Tax=Xylophilus rhododendri TaxID=2697032 RepID=A0A857J811_9BURK|nr:hypothetical protein [Xylophilus rhododendri]QHJ00007.1 hypothetical protein GT347_19685 [Xylophilus rhododendri]